MPKRQEDHEKLDRLISQLDDLKRLVILQLLASGIPSGQIAKALRVDSSVISRMMPAREIQKLSRLKAPSDRG